MKFEGVRVEIGKPLSYVLHPDAVSLRNRTNWTTTVILDFHPEHVSYSFDMSFY